MNTFTCDRCHETFVKVRTDADARREYQKLFPIANARGDEEATLCDECWQEFMVWAKRNGIAL